MTRGERRAYLREAVRRDLRLNGRPEDRTTLADIVRRLERAGYRDPDRPPGAFRSEVANALAHLRRAGLARFLPGGGWL